MRKRLYMLNPSCSIRYHQFRQPASLNCSHDYISLNTKLLFKDCTNASQIWWCHLLNQSTAKIDAVDKSYKCLYGVCKQPTWRFWSWERKRNGEEPLLCTDTHHPLLMTLLAGTRLYPWCESNMSPKEHFRFEVRWLWRLLELSQSIQNVNNLLNRTI